MRKKHNRNKITLRKIISDVANDNFKKIMFKARQYSRLAKQLVGKGRLVAYSQKDRCLQHIIQKDSKSRIVKDMNAEDSELLVVYVGNERPLHTKKKWLSKVSKV